MARRRSSVVARPSCSVTAISCAFRYVRIDTRVVYRQVFRTAVKVRHRIAPHTHNLADQVVCLADSQRRIIHESCLRVPPFVSEPLLFLLC